MTFRIGWLSPLTPASGVGTFSHAVTSKLPTTVDGEAIDLTLLYPDHAVLHHSRRTSLRSTSPRALARSDATTWLQLSTTRAGLPAGGDTRILGVCFMTLKVVTGSSNEVRELADLSDS